MMDSCLASFSFQNWMKFQHFRQVFSLSKFIYIYIYILSYTHTHTHTHIYIYIYIYIYIHLETACFVVSQLFSVAKHVRRLKLWSKPTQLYVRLIIIPTNQQANHTTSGIIRYYVVVFVCLHFCLTWYQSAQFIRRALCECQP